MRKLFWKTTANRLQLDPVGIDEVLDRFVAEAQNVHGLMQHGEQGLLVVALQHRGKGSQVDGDDARHRPVVRALLADARRRAPAYLVLSSYRPQNSAGTL